MATSTQLQSSQSPAGQAIWQAIKRTPGLIAGGAVDVANLALGLLSGKGLSGLSAKPVGGGEWINEQFGMIASKDALQQGTEAALSMLSPGGVAKALIIPAVAAKATLKELTTARKLINQGKANEAYQTYKMYEDPATGELLKVIPDTQATLNPDKFNLGTNVASKGPRRPLYVTSSVYAPASPLPDVLKHPEIYSLIPELQSTIVGRGVKLGPYSPYFPSDYGAAFLPPYGNMPAQIGLGNRYNTVDNLDPWQGMINALLHETQHNIQNVKGMPGGGSVQQFFQDYNRFTTAQKALEALKSTGGAGVQSSIKALKNAQTQAEKAYLRIPGEVQARLVQLQYATGDYTTNPLTLMRSMGIDPTTLTTAPSSAKVDVDPLMQKILDVYAPVKGQTP